MHQSHFHMDDFLETSQLGLRKKFVNKFRYFKKKCNRFDLLSYREIDVITSNACTVLPITHVIASRNDTMTVDRTLPRIIRHEACVTDQNKTVAAILLLSHVAMVTTVVLYVIPLHQWRHASRCAGHGAHSSNPNYVPRKERRYHVKNFH